MSLPQGIFKHTIDHEKLSGIVDKFLTAGQVLTSANSNTPVWETTRGTWATRPASPYAGQRYFATDRGDGGIEYAWDGAKWLSTQLFLIPMVQRQAQPFAQSNQSFEAVIPYYDLGGSYVSVIQCKFLANGTAQSGVNYYSASLQKISTAGGNTAVALTGTTDTKTFAANLWSGMTMNVGAVLGATIDQLELAFNLTGAPGSYYLYGTFAVKLVG